jgi:hypothetical protein
MAKSTDIPTTNSYSSTVRKSLLVDEDGNYFTIANPLPVDAVVTVGQMTLNADLQVDTGHDLYSVNVTRLGNLAITFSQIPGLVLKDVQAMENKTQGWVYITKGATVTDTTVTLVASVQASGYIVISPGDEIEFVYRGTSRHTNKTAMTHITNGTSELDILTQDSSFGTSVTGLAMFGKYETTSTIYADGDAVPIALDEKGQVKLSNVDIEIGSVEIKNAYTDERVFVQNATSPVTATSSVMLVQSVDSTGNVSPAGNIAANSPFVRVTDGNEDLEILTQASSFGTTTKGLALFGKFETTSTVYTDGDAVPLALDEEGKIKLANVDIEIGAVEIKNSTSDTRVDVVSDGTNNAMFIQANSLDVRALVTSDIITVELSTSPVLSVQVNGTVSAEITTSPVLSAEVTGNVGITTSPVLSAEVTGSVGITTSPILSAEVSGSVGITTSPVLSAEITGSVGITTSPILSAEVTGNVGLTTSPVLSAQVNGTVSAEITTSPVLSCEVTGNVGITTSPVLSAQVHGTVSAAITTSPILSAQVHGNVGITTSPVLSAQVHGTVNAAITTSPVLSTQVHGTVSAAITTSPVLSTQVNGVVNATIVGQTLNAVKVSKDAYDNTATSPIYVSVTDGTSTIDYVNVLVQDSAYGTTTKGLAVFGKFETTSTVYADGDAVPISLNNTGQVNVVVTTSPVLSAQVNGSVAITTSPVLSAQINGSVALTGTSPITGDIAHDASDSGNPVKIGGQARQTNPTAVADGDRVNAIFDDLGRQVVVLNGIRDLMSRQATTLTSTTAETTIVTGTASVFHDLANLVITNSSATATVVTIRDATATSPVMVVAIAANGGAVIPFNCPLKQTVVNNNWTAQCSVSVASIEVFAQFITNV